MISFVENREDGSQMGKLNWYTKWMWYGGSIEVV